jgi:hypothetical protein
MAPRFTNHQLYLNGQKVLEGRGLDYTVIGNIEDQTIAFEFMVKKTDRITLVLLQRDLSFVEVDLDPKNAHRLCDSCGKNSMPQPEAEGFWFPEFPKSVCIPCTVKALRKEIASFRDVLAERRKQLKGYRRLYKVSTKRKGVTRDYQDILVVLDAPTRLFDLAESTEKLVERSETRMVALRELLAELTEAPKRLVNILR